MGGGFVGYHCECTIANCALQREYSMGSGRQERGELLRAGESVCAGANNTIYARVTSIGDQ